MIYNSYFSHTFFILQLLIVHKKSLYFAYHCFKFYCHYPHRECTVHTIQRTKKQHERLHFSLYQYGTLATLHAKNPNPKPYTQILHNIKSYLHSRWCSLKEKLSIQAFYYTTEQFSSHGILLVREVVSLSNSPNVMMLQKVTNKWTTKKKSANNVKLGFTPSILYIQKEQKSNNFEHVYILHPYYNEGINNILGRH